MAASAPGSSLGEPVGSGCRSCRAPAQPGRVSSGISALGAGSPWVQPAPRMLGSSWLGQAKGADRTFPV